MDRIDEIIKEHRVPDAYHLRARSILEQAIKEVLAKAAKECSEGYTYNQDVLIKQSLTQNCNGRI